MQLPRACTVAALALCLVGLVPASPALSQERSWRVHTRRAPPAGWRGEIDADELNENQFVRRFRRLASRAVLVKWAPARPLADGRRPRGYLLLFVSGKHGERFFRDADRARRACELKAEDQCDFLIEANVSTHSLYDPNTTGTWDHLYVLAEYEGLRKPVASCSIDDMESGDPIPGDAIRIPAGYHWAESFPEGGPVTPVPVTPAPAAAEGGDATSPLVEILKPAPGATLAGSTTVHVVARVTDNSGRLKLVHMNGVAVAPRAGDGLYILQVEAREGANRVVVQAWDHADNSAFASLTFRDQRPPEVSGSLEISFKGRTDDPTAKVTVNGKPVKVNADGSFECRVVPDANGKITVVAVDEFGNETRQVHDIRGR